jgi:hypothetical protein
MKAMNQISPQAKSALTLVGKAIAERPLELRRLLARYRIIVGNGKEDQTLAEAVLYGLQLGDRNFQQELSAMLSGSEDNFVGAIAGAVGSIANVVGGAQQSKAMKEQTRNESLATILAYKAQQDQNKLNQARLRLDQQKKRPENPPSKSSQTETLLIAGGVIVALLIMMVFYQTRKQTQQVTPVSNTKMK